MIEIIHNHIERGHIRHAVFDFDGTLSLIREGWQQVMASVMLDELMQTPRHESAPELRRYLIDLVVRTTGQTTIRQMVYLADEINRRGGLSQDPVIYKQKFLERLGERIGERIAAIEAGHISADEWMVPGARAMLDALHARGVRCYLISGTDEPRVLEEAAVLQIAPYFVSIRGANDDPTGFSKKQFIEHLVAEHRLRGPELVSIGDGGTEIEETKRVGGIAVGVASNEATRVGVDERKRDKLIQAGADMIVPDFRECEELVAYLFDAR
jgi:phosphoglycolate phosphatase